MKDRWKNNLGLKIMAVLFAVFLWWAVVNIDDPVKDKTFKIEVDVTNTDVITSNGKSYKIVNDATTVTVTVTARRKVLSEITAEDIVATADLREMDGTTLLVPIRVTVKGFQNNIESATANPRNIQIQTEDTQKRTFTIEPVATGEVRDGHEVGSMVVEPQTIDISGPKSVLNRIERVVAKADVSEMSEDGTVLGELIYYDSAGNIIDKSQLSSNCDKKGVSVDVTIYAVKKIGLQFDTSEINPADGYVFSGLGVEPNEIEVAGLDEKLADLQTLTIGSEALKKDGLTTKTEVVVDVVEYLPDGIKIAGGATEKKIVVSIILEKAGTKSILLPVRSIKVSGVAEEFELTYGPEQEVELRFSGSNDVLASLTSEKILAKIDLASYKEEGTYDVPVQVTDSPDGCEYLGEVTVQIILTKNVENTENTENDNS